VLDELAADAAALHLDELHRRGMGNAAHEVVDAAQGLEGDAVAGMELFARCSGKEPLCCNAHVSLPAFRRRQAAVNSGRPKAI